MDFNFKSKLWAESIYHQFESMCQDVDGFVNKEAVKFVGNQVQSVGLSVKRLYSDVVQDILPLSGDTAKPERQLAAGEQVDKQERVTSSTYTDEIKLEKNEVSNDHKIQSFKPADVAEVQTCQDLTEQGDAMVQNNEDSIISAETDVTTDLKLVTANSSFDGEIFSGKSDEDISTSPAFSAHEEDSTFIGKERKDFNHKKADEGFSGDTMCLSDTLIEQGNATVQNSDDSINSAEKNVTTDLKPVPANSSFDGEIFSGMSDEDISSSPAFSAHEEGSTFIEEERRDFNHKKGDEGFSGDTMCFSDTSSTASLSESELPMIDDLYLDVNGSLSSPPVPVSTHKVDQDNCPLMDSPLPPACDVDDGDFNHKKGDEGFSGDTMCLSDTSSTASLYESNLQMIDDLYLDVNGSLSSPPVPVSIHNVTQDNCSLMDSPLPPSCDVDDGAQEKCSALSKSCSTKDDSVDLSTYVQSSEHVFSCSCDEKEEEIAVTPSTSCTSPKSSISMESTSADFSEEAENVLHSRSESSIKVDVDPASLMMESNDNSALHTDRSDIVDSSLESGHEEHYKNGHSKIVISPSETENKYGFSVPIGDLDMENVDLSSNVKHDGRSVVLYSNFAAAGSFRRKNFRYYKKLIQGAFTSRKRLTKEYEHLAIMYGDIDVESDHHFKPSSLPSFPDTALHAEGTQSCHEMSENEWELL